MNGGGLPTFEVITSMLQLGPIGSVASLLVISFCNHRPSKVNVTRYNLLYIYFD